VVLAGVNDDELGDLLDFARSRNAELRFIEYMDVGGATGWRPDAVVPRETILERVSEHVGAIPTPLADRGSAPAERFALPDGSTFGVIASTTAPFCAACDRARLTADGMMFPCLYASQGLDLKTVLRSGADDDQLRQALTEFWTARADRGAEERLQQPERGALIPADALRRNPHLEMHTRGG